ncbi:uncharacterized protein PpBr36_06378 [Pyricularia pennisetigena]|uniref:uncharacterized protein n=1 Tax=Pyricularia pennisetigena TaxID=1578925 RepID=UPI00114E7685|nr:uncharacterized protein PpBr36_06378 [Pyricularia pennisetigena]TLS23551.1 hypothetical protein PpBr36_06378 [Pyricularia pennisetigena]
MRGSLLALAALLAPLCAAQANGNSTQSTPKPDKDGKYWIYGKGISAAFVPYGASIANLMIHDKHGIERDIVTGFDNATFFTEDKKHDHFGGIPGRYANRIKNSTFEIDGVQYKIRPNEHKTAEYPEGLNTLHGGPNGWDWRNFTVVSHSNDSITFSIHDADGEEGFPGEVVSYVTYTLKDMQWDFKIVALSLTKKTPIMLTSHTYWNLDGFSNNETNTIFNHTFHMPYGGQRVAVDNILIPTGDILANQKYSVNDFWSAPKQIGANQTSPELLGNCGFNCTGYDNCWLVNRDQSGPFDWRESGPVATLSSDWSGIKLDIYTDQEAFQMYSCGGQDGTMPLKKTQGITDNPDFPRTIPKYGCVVLEVQDYIDAINQPSWGRQKKQIFGPGDDPYVVQASYRFSVQ